MELSGGFEWPIDGSAGSDGSARNGFPVPGGPLASGKLKLGLEVLQRPQNPAQPRLDLHIRVGGLDSVKVGGRPPAAVFFFSPVGSTLCASPQTTGHNRVRVWQCR